MVAHEGSCGIDRERMSALGKSRLWPSGGSGLCQQRAGRSNGSERGPLQPVRPWASEPVRTYRPFLGPAWNLLQSSWNGFGKTAGKQRGTQSSHQNRPGWHCHLCHYRFGNTLRVIKWLVWSKGWKLVGLDSGHSPLIPHPCPPKNPVARGCARSKE